MRCKSQLLVLLLILTSCANNTTFHPAVFPKSGHAEIEVIGDAMVINLPLDIYVEGNNICVLAYTPKFWLHIYNRQTGELISEAVPVGRGPGEAINVRSMDYDRDAQLLCIHSPNLNKSVYYRIDGDIGKAIFVDEVQHPQEAIIRDCHLLSGNRFLYEGYLPGEDRFTRFFLYEDGKMIANYIEFPGVEKEEDKYSFMMSRAKSDPRTGKFVSGTLYGAVLECFDLSDDTFDRIGLRLIDPPGVDMSGGGIDIKKGSKWGFSNFCLTEDRIYASFLNSDDVNSFSSVSVFGWDGKEKARYETGSNILRLATNPDNKKSLYGIVCNPEMTYSLARIELPR